MTIEEAERLLESLTVAERKDIPLEDFAWPEERKYPVDTQEHLDALATLIGRAPEAEQPKIKARAITIAKRHGFTLPQSWQDEKQESAASVASSSVRPAKKIATLKVCFLEYNARSLNGRIYPKATCDKIYSSGLAKLADTNALPMTVFVSHETANSNANTELVGRIVKLWQEGSKFYANLDLADTRVARDMLALAEGGYLQSESMRVMGVELLHDHNYDLPLVVPQEGVEPELMGIDLTTRPGLIDSARILQALYESQQQPPYTETFDLVDAVRIESREEPPAMELPIFLKIILGELTEATTPDRAAHLRVHDHLAGVLDEAVKPMHGDSAEAALRRRGLLTEEGRALAKKHAARLALAHDESAKACGMTCEGCYHEALGMQKNAPSDTDNDGDDPANGYDPDNDGESQKKGKKVLTEEEMIAALKAKGFAVEQPKTSEQLLQESFDAKLAAQKKEFDERLAALTNTSDPQRQTLALSNQTEESTLKPEELYEDGDYLKGDLAPKNWRALSDRRVPWPHDKLDPKQALAEMAPFLAFRLNMEEAHARGRDISQFIESHEQV